MLFYLICSFVCYFLRTALDEERKINAQKFEVAFYANPDMRKVEQELRQPETEQGTDLQKLLTQLQENPELAAQLKALLNAK